jgi:hypothetical protein
MKHSEAAVPQLVATLAYIHRRLFDLSALLIGSLFKDSTTTEKGRGYVYGTRKGRGGL